MFRLAGIGPIVGGRTFGAGIGPYGYGLTLMDGARIHIPNRGAYDPAGSWGIENVGVAPHVPVAITPEAWRAGRDPQLEEAIRQALAAKQTAKIYRHPAFPIHPFKAEPK